MKMGATISVTKIHPRWVAFWRRPAPDTIHPSGELARPGGSVTRSDVTRRFIMDNDDATAPPVSQQPIQAFVTV